MSEGDRQDTSILMLSMPHRSGIGTPLTIDLWQWEQGTAQPGLTALFTATLVT